MTPPRRSCSPSSALTSLSLSGTPALHVPGLSVSAASASVALSGGTTTVSVTGAVLDAGGLALRANLALTTAYDATGARTVTITLSQHTGGTGSHDFVSIAGVLTVANATGSLVATASGTSGSVGLTGFVLDPTTFGSSASATSVTLSFGGASTSIEITGASLSINGFTFAGNLVLDRSGTMTRLAFSGLTVSGGGSSLTNATGGFVLTPAGSTGGVAGVFTADLNGTFSGVSATGKVLVRVNTSHVAVDESLEVGGRTVAVQFANPGPTATVFDIAITDATLTIGNFLVIQGSLSSVACPGTTSGCRTLAGQGLRIFVGTGPAFLGGGINPLATGVLVDNATIGIVEVTTTTPTATTTYAVVATGTVRLVGVDGVTLAGTVGVRWNDTGADVHRSVTFEGSTVDPVQVDVATGVRSFSLTGATIGILGQTLTADLTVDRTVAGDTVLGFSNASLDLGPATLRNGSGLLVLGPTGVAGRVAGDLGLAVPGVTFGAGISLAVNTRPTAVNQSLVVGGTTTRLDLAAGPYLRLDGAGVSLTVLEQSITADVSVVRTATGTTIGLARVGLQLMANGYGVSLTNGSGVLVVDAAGVAGRIYGQVALVLPAGVSASGDLVLSLNTSTASVATSITVGGVAQELDLPGGPYLRFEATGLRLTVSGQVLTGDFAFEKVATSPTTSIIKVSATHVALDLAGVLRLREGTALVLLTDAGLAASIAGTVSLDVPGVTIEGTLATQLNTTGGDVNQTFTVAGVPTTLALTAGAPLRVVGTDLRLVVLGQTLTGDLTVTRSLDAAGRAVLRIDAQRLALVLGSGATTATLTQSGAATLTVGPTGVSADLGVAVGISVPGVTVAGTVRLVMDSATGYLKASGPSVDLNVLGQRIRGAFVFEQVGAGTARVVRIGVTAGTLDLGGLVSVSDAEGLFVLSNGGVAGQLSARLALTTPGALDLSGSFSLALNTSALAVRQSVQVGAREVLVDVPAGPYLRVSGTGVVIKAAGQVLTGDVTVEKADTIVRLTAANVRMQLGDGKRTLVRLTDGSADLTLGAAVTGTVSGTVALVNVPQVGLSGSFTATFSATNPKLRVTGANVVLTLAGQTLSARKVTFTQGADEVTVSLEGGELTFADGSGRPLVRATDIDGDLHFLSAGATGGGMYGAIDGTVAVDVPGVSFTADLSVQVNTTPNPHDVTVNGATVNLLAGTMRFKASGAKLVIAGQEIGGTFTVTRTPLSSGGYAVLIDVDDATLALGGVVNFQTSNHLDGTVLVTPTGVSASITVGDLGGAITFPVGSGISFGTGTTASLQINTAATAVDLTPTGGSAIRLPAGPYLKIALGNGTSPVLKVGSIDFTGNVTIERSSRPGYVATTLTVTSDETSLATGDVDKDGRADLLVGTTSTTNGYRVLLGGATASATAGQPDTITYTAPSGPATVPTVARATAAVALADLDGDGWLDLVLVGSGSTGTTTVLRNRGLGPTGCTAPVTSCWQGFASAVTGLASGDVRSVAVGDVTGDGFSDLVVAGAGGTKYFAGTGTAGAWTGVSATAATISSSAASDVVLADVDNNTTLDVFIAGSGGDKLYLTSNPGITPRTFTASPLTTPASSSLLVVGDLNGDNLPDVVASDGTGAPVVYYNKGLNNGTLTPATTWQGFDAPLAVPGTGPAATDLALGDLDGDGRRDLVVSTPTATWTYRNNGCSTALRACFDTRRQVTGAAGTGAAVVNVDTDTDADLVTYGVTGTVRVFQQHPVATTVIGLAGVSVSLGTTDGLSISDGQGAFILYSGTGAGVAGTFAGTISGGDSTVSVNASGAVRFNSTNHAVDEVVTVAGTDLPVTFSASEIFGSQTAGKPFIKVAGKATIKIGTFIEITGAGSAGQLDSATVFVGVGPYHLDDDSVNPNAKGLLITGLSGSLGGTAPSRTLSATGTVSLIGFPGLTFSGIISVEGSEGPTGTAKVGGVITFAVPGFSLFGTFGITYSAANGLTIKLGTANSVSDLPAGVARQAVSFGLGPADSSSKHVVDVRISSATMVIKSGGVVADLTASVDLQLPGETAQTGLTGSLKLNTTGALDTLTGIPAHTVRVVLSVAAGSPLVIGGQSFSGTFAFEQVTIPPAANAQAGTPATTQVRIAATNVSLTLGTSTAGVQLSGGSGAFLISPTGLAAQFGGHALLVVPGMSVTGELSLALNTGTTAASALIDMGGGQSVSLNLPAGRFLRFTGTGLVLDLGGQRITADVTVQQQTVGGVTTTYLDLANGSISFGTGATPVVSLSQATAHLVLAGSYVAGTVSGRIDLNLPGVVLGGTLALRLNTDPLLASHVVGGVTIPAGMSFTGTAISLTLGGQTLTVATLTVTQRKDTATGATTTELALEGASLQLPGLGSINAAGNLVAGPTGVAGQLVVGTTLAVGSLSLTGAIRLTMNSGAQALDVTVKDGPTTTTVRIPGGPYLRVEGLGLRLAIGDFAINGNFVVERATSTTGQTRTVLAVSGASVTIGTDTLLGGVEGALVLLSDDPATTTVVEPTGMVARVRGTVNASAFLPPSVQLQGTFELAINQTTAEVNERVTVGDTSVLLQLPPGSFVRVAATGVVLTVAGQTLTGDLSFQRSGATTVLAVANLGINLGGGLITLEHGTGTFTISPTAFNGQIAGDVAVHVPGLQLGGNFRLNVDTATSLLSVSGTGVYVEVAGQRIAGNFTFTQSGVGAARTITLTITNLDSFFGQAGIGAISAANGYRGLHLSTPVGTTSTIVLTSAGTVVDLSATVELVGLPSAITFGGVGTGIPVRLQLNTGTAPATLGSGADQVTLPAGLLRIQLGTVTTPVELGLAGFVSLKGVLSIEKAPTPGADGLIGTADDASGLRIAATHVEVFVGDPGTSSDKSDDTGLWLTDGTALLLLGGDATTGGFAGSISASAALYLGQGVAASVDRVRLDLNQRTGAVHEEFSVDGENFLLDLPGGPYLDVTLTGLRIAFNGFALRTDLGIRKTTAGLTLRFSDLTMGIGPDGHPVVLVSDGAGVLDVTAGGIQGSMTVGVALDVPGVTLSGTFGLTLDTHPSTRKVEVVGTNIVLGVAGLRLTGGFKVTQNGTSHEVLIAPNPTLSLELGSATETFVKVTLGGGGVLITPTGVVIDMTATLTLGEALATRLGNKLQLGTLAVKVRVNPTLSVVKRTTAANGFDFGGTDGVPAGSAVAPYVLIVAGDPTPVNITVLGQTLSGVFTFEQTTARTPSGASSKVVRISFSQVGLFLGDPTIADNLTTTDVDERVGLVVSHGTGAILITTGGVAGSISADLGITDGLKAMLPGGADFNTTVSVDLNTMPTAVDQTFGGVHLNVPAGPFLRAAVTGFTLGFTDTSTGTQYRILGNFLFQKARLGGADVLTVAMAGVNLQKLVSGTWTGVGITEIEGLLLVNPRGQAGFAFTLSGAISVSGAGFTAGGRLGVVVNRSAANMSGTNAASVDVNGTLVTIDAAANSVSVTATDVAFDFGGLVEIRGNFAFDQFGNFHGSNLSLFVGKGPSTSPDAIGLMVTNATVDFHKFDATTFVLKVTGGVALVGLDGLQISGNVDLRINTSSVDCSAASTASPSTDACGGVRQVSPGFFLQVSNLHLGVRGTLDVSGTLLVSRQPNGTLDLAIANANVMVGISGQTVVQLSGYAGFSISPLTGFRLSGFKVSDFALFPSLSPELLTAFRTADYTNVTTTNTNAPTPTLFPTVDLAGPVNGGMVTATELVANRPGCGTGMCLLVRYNDVNHAGLNATSINDPAQEFEIWVNGTQSTATISAPRLIVGQLNTYGYNISGFALPAAGSLVEIRFLQGAFTDGNGNGSMAETERFFVVTKDTAGNVTSKPAPTAIIAGPSNGETISATELNRRRYIDVTFTSQDGNPIYRQSIEDAAAEFTLSGAGVRDVLLDANGAPITLGVPLLISGLGDTALSRTYRYYFKDRNTANTIDLFGPGEVVVTFQQAYAATPAYAWATSANAQTAPDTTSAHAGWNILGLRQTFTLSPAADGSSTATGSRSLGPLSLDGPSIGITDVGFSDGMLVLTIALGANHAGLNFGGGQSGSGVSVDLIGLQGTFDLAVDAFALLGGTVRIAPTGKWGVRIASLEAQVSTVARLTAEGIQFGYDPAHDPATGHQELLRISSASITFPTLGVTGSLRPYDPVSKRNLNAPTDGSALASGVVPGLIVYDDGFKLGTAELAYGLPPLPAGQTAQAGNELRSTQSQTDRDINLFGILKLNDLRVGVQGLGVTFGASSSTFDGTIYIATGGATLFPGRAFSASITDRTTADDVNPDGTANTEAFRAQLTFSGSRIDSFQLQVDTLSVQLGQFATLSASGFSLNTGASASEELIRFASVGATVRIAGLELSGTARNFGFLGDGTFKTYSGFGIFLSVGSATGDSFKWPSFMPVRIDSIGVEWVDVQNHPEDFVLVLSASVTGIKGISGLQFSGSIQGVRIQPSLLAQGQFPIIRIDSLGVSVSGKMFGGEITAGLVGGIMRLDSSYREIGVFDNTTPVAKRVFYLGIQGGFEMAGLGGFTIRIGLSELGPLQVFLNVEIPTGIPIFPPIGLTLNDFSAGVEFFKTLPSIDDPFALRNAAFALPTNQTADTWLDSLKSQVALQAATLATNPSMSGFEAAFSAPMTFTGSARIYSSFTSQAVFNGLVTIMISTDGKFMIHGQLNFANNNLSISGRLYADLSRVAQGDATVLFLADIPDQVQILTLYGKLKMGFRDASGQEIVFTVPDEGTGAGAVTTPPTVDLVTPSGSVDAAVLNQILSNPGTRDRYLDVLYQAAPGATLDWLRVMKGLSNPTVKVHGATAGTGDGRIVTTTPIGLVSLSSAPDTASVTVLSEACGTGCRQAYFVDGTTHVVLATTTASAAAFTDAQLVAEGRRVLSATLVPLRLEDRVIDGTTYRQVFYMNGTTKVYVVNTQQLTGLTTDVDANLLAAAMRITGASRVRYLLGTADVPIGVVTADFAAGAFKNADSADGSVTGAVGAHTVLSFTVTGTTAVVTDPGNGGNVDVNALNHRDWVDVKFTWPAGRPIDLGSIADLAAEFALSGPGLGSITVDGGRAPTNMCLTTTFQTPSSTDCTSTSVVFRYWLVGQWGSGAVTLGFLPNTWAYQLNAALPTSTVTMTSLHEGNMTLELTLTLPSGTAGWSLDEVSRAALMTLFTDEWADDPSHPKSIGLQIYHDGDWVITLVTTGAVQYDPTSGHLFLPVVVTKGETWSDGSVSTASPTSKTFSLHTTATSTTVSATVSQGTAPSGTTAAGDTRPVIVPTGARTFIDVRYGNFDSGLNIFTINLNHVSLGGTGQGSASISQVLGVGNGTYRYLIDGSFRPGEVIVTLKLDLLNGGGARGPPAGWTDTQSFSVVGTTADLVRSDTVTATDGSTSVVVTAIGGRNLGRDWFNAKHYLEVRFSGTNGYAIDPATINGDELRLVGPGGAVIVLGSPVRVGTTDVWRYFFSGSLAAGEYALTFQPGSVRDTGANANQVETERFWLVATSDGLTDPVNGSTQTTNDFNGRTWIDITFSGAKPDSVLDNQAEFTVKGVRNGVATNTYDLIVVGNPVRLGNSDVYRYFLVGLEAPTADTTTTSLVFTWIASSWTDAGDLVHGLPTAKGPDDITLLSTGSAESITDIAAFRARSWIDVTFTPTGTATVDTSTVTGNELGSIPGLTQYGAGTAADPKVFRIGTSNTFRYLFTGDLNPGAVTVTVVAGSWADSEGNLGTGSTSRFTLIKPAQSFYIEIAGGLQLRAPFVPEPLLDLSARVVLEINPVAKTFILTFDGQLKLYKVGPVGATTGRFVLDLGDGTNSTPGFWGVASLETNFSFLEPYGIFLFAKGTFQINTTGVRKTETITLKGIGEGGSDVTRTYNLEAGSFSLELVGQLRVRPPGTTTDLLRLQGGFFISLKTQGEFELTVFATAELSFGIGDAQLTYGHATALLVAKAGPNGLGVAGSIEIGAGGGIGLPDLGTAFRASGSVKVMFNTLRRDVTFVLPPAFRPLLVNGDPGEITIFGSAPALDGGRNPSAPPGGEIYVKAIVEAHLVIGEVIVADGFISITAAVDPGDSSHPPRAYLKIDGAVGVQIPILGSMSGTLNLAVFIGTTAATTGVVGRIQLTRGASSAIPGVALSGQFLLEFSTFTDDVTIQTFMVKQRAFNYSYVDANGVTTTGSTQVFDGLDHDAAGRLVVGNATIGNGFKLLMSGTLAIGDKIFIDNSAVIRVSTSELTVVLNGTMALGPLGTVQVVNSGFRITSAGLVANLDVRIGSTFGASTGLAFRASVLLQLNTTGAVQSLCVEGIACSTPSQIAPGFLLDIRGSITIAAIQGSGFVRVRVGATGFELEFGVHFDIGGLLFDANGAAGVYADGIVLRLNVHALADVTIFSIDASGTIEVNTTGSVRLGVAQGFLLRLSGKLSILKVLNLDANFLIQYRPRPSSTDWSWHLHADASVDFFGLASLSGVVDLYDNGDFNVELHGRMVLGSDDYGLVGNFNFQVTSQHYTKTGDTSNVYYRFYIGASASVKVRAFGITLAGVGLGFEVRLDTGDVTQGGSVPIVASVYVSVDFGLFEIGGTVRITIGYLQLPPPVWMGSDCSYTTCTTGTTRTWAGTAPAVLYLNVGDRAASRNIGQLDPNETMTIEQIGGTSGDATIKVSAYGRSNVYEHVSRIEGRFAGGNDALFVKPGVAVPVIIDAGDGDDAITYQGSASCDPFATQDESNRCTSLSGGIGNDFLSAFGRAILDGGAGNDILTHTGGDAAKLSGGDGDDKLFGAHKDDELYGGNGKDVLSGPAKTYVGDDLGTDQTGHDIDTFLIDMSRELATAITINGGGGRDVAVLTFGARADSIELLSPTTTAYTMRLRRPRRQHQRPGDHLS